MREWGQSERRGGTERERRNKGEREREPGYGNVDTGLCVDQTIDELSCGYWEAVMGRGCQKQSVLTD